MINLNANRPTFKQNIKIVPLDEYLKKITPNSIEVGSGLFGDYQTNWNTNNSIYTPGIGSCTAYGITNVDNNPKDCYLLHYNQKPDSIIKPLTDDKQSKGFIIGGYKGSEEHFFKDTYKENFQDKSKPATVIWGQSDGMTNILYEPNIKKPDESTWYIYKAKDLRGKDYVKNEADFKSAFFHINITPEHNLFIGKKQIDPKKVMQNINILI